MATQKRRVAYYYHQDIPNYYYGPSHPMKPHRLALAHSLILAYDLHNQMEIYRPHPASFEEICKFHSEDYIRFLHKINPNNTNEMMKEMQRFNVGFVGQYDCPVFEDIFPFCQLYSGGSIEGAARMNHGLVDACINWSGGLHHAKKAEASGFCYVNDVVLAILEMLKRHPRVVYIDIDIHHGDGVQEAFYYTDRVMTVSFHKYGDFFPGTGDITEIGEKTGKYYAINVPLNDGIDDMSYATVFKPVMTAIMASFRPGAIVLQCGADSLAGDRLGSFNMTVKGHAECVKFMTSFNVPMLVVGGGGYTIRNVARCWAYETSVMIGKDVPNDIPFCEYWEYFAPSYQLHYPPSQHENKNTRESLEKIKIEIFENLRALQGAPGVEMQQMPAEIDITSDDDDDDEDPDVRESQKTLDRRIRREEEWYEDDHDNDDMHDDDD